MAFPAVLAPFSLGEFTLYAARCWEFIGMQQYCFSISARIVQIAGNYRWNGANPPYQAADGLITEQAEQANCGWRVLIVRYVLIADSTVDQVAAVHAGGGDSSERLYPEVRSRDFQSQT